VVVTLFVGRGDRRKILVSLDGFLTAQFAAAENEDGRDDGNDAADDDAECSVAVFVHDVSNVCSSARFRTEWASNSAKIVAEIGPFHEMKFAHKATQMRENIRSIYVATHRDDRLRSGGVNRYDML
jgi:hypothetical protein